MIFIYDVRSSVAYCVLNFLLDLNTLVYISRSFICHNDIFIADKYIDMLRSIDDLCTNKNVYVESEKPTLFLVGNTQKSGVIDIDCFDIKLHDYVILIMKLQIMSI